MPSCSFQPPAGKLLTPRGSANRQASDRRGSNGGAPSSAPTSVPPAASAIVRTTLRHFAARSALFAPGRGLVVGFSGGQDSACLLHALAELRRDHRFELWAAHVDHALRPDSAADAARALGGARPLGVEAL